MSAGPPLASDFLVARQPVFDRELALAGYELLVAGGETADGAGADVSRALSQLVLGGGDLDSILGEQPLWLKLPNAAARETGESRSGARRATIELEPNGDGADSLAAAKKALADHGFKVAVDVSGADPDAASAAIADADVVTVDVSAMSAEQMARTAERLRAATSVSLAASSVDSPESYQAAHAAGFELFRGEFFKKPTSRESDGVAPSRLAVLRLLAALQDPNVELRELATLFGQDVALTYRLLRYINSAFFGMRREVTSISHALALLGLQNLKRWATVVILAKVDHRPRELLTTALVRARFCELLGPHYRQSDADQLFTLGLFSVLDALMDVPMVKALRPLPLGDEMERALTLKRGPKGEVLSCALEAEQGGRCRNAPIDHGALADLYRQSLEWGTESATAL